MGESAINAEREQAILDAAYELIIRYGYGKTIVEDIAKAAHIAKGTVYLHFKSKEELFNALITRESDRVIDRIFVLIDADPEGVTVFNMYRYGWQGIQENPLMRALYTRDQRVLGDYARKVAAMPQYQQLSQFSTDFVRYFQKLGIIRDDIDAETVMLLLSAFRYGLLIVPEIMPEGSMPPMEVVGIGLAKVLSGGFGDQGSGNSEEGKRALRELYMQGIELLRSQHSQAKKESGKTDG